ncbi:MAG: hypothetical protein OHK0045_08110 [Raineya sp.]
MIDIQTAILSDKGLQQSINQDYAIECATSQGYLWVLADGEGNAPRGLYAARLMADAIRTYIEDHKADNKADLLRKALQQANEILHKRMLIAEGVVAFADAKQLHFAVFGKSKAFKLKGKELEDISNNNGTLGQSAAMQIQVISSNLQHSLQILLLTKGAFLQLTFEQIIEILSSKKTKEEKLESLLRITHQKGGQYNASIALIELPAISIAKIAAQTWKKARPYAFPIFLITFLAVFVITFQNTHQKQQEAETNEQKKNIAEFKEKQRIKDSLAQVDAAKDEIITHKMQKGETIGTVARKYNTTIEGILSLNTLDDKASVYAGQQIKVNIKMIYITTKEQTIEEIYEERFKRWEKMGITTETIRKANLPKTLNGKLPKGTKIIIPALKKEKY